MTHKTSAIDRTDDPREIPAYTTTEAARYLRLAPATLRSWVAGRAYPKRGKQGFFQPLIQPPSTSPTQLSFSNLVEAHTLRALRTEHGVSIKAVRSARKFAENKYGIKRLLLSPELRTEAGELFLDKYRELVNLTRSGQLAMKRVLQAHLTRVEWDVNDLPLRLFPFLHPSLAYESTETPNAIVIDPFVSFGRPVIRRKGISTAAIVDRIDAGEPVEDLVQDYDLQLSEIEEAIVYERAA